MSTYSYVDAARHVCDDFFVRYVMSEAQYTLSDRELYLGCKCDVKELGLRCLGKGHIREDDQLGAGGNVTFVGVLLSSKRAIQQFVAEAPLCGSCHYKLFIASEAHRLDDTEMVVEVSRPEPMSIIALVNTAAAALITMAGLW
ncbi:hypothetical protein N7G274_000947 [Stereocaulon virgatum]|uniref:Uncharacterized protein n=1 Tax=Stereocaulon virgatum TaxID=373712 RepID=A0ABR4AN28_9LECA